MKKPYWTKRKIIPLPPSQNKLKTRLWISKLSYRTLLRFSVAVHNNLTGRWWILPITKITKIRENNILKWNFETKDYKVYITMYVQQYALLDFRNRVISVCYMDEKNRFFAYRWNTRKRLIGNTIKLGYKLEMPDEIQQHRFIQSNFNL